MHKASAGFTGSRRPCRGDVEPHLGSNSPTGATATATSHEHHDTMPILYFAQLLLDPPSIIAGPLVFNHPYREQTQCTWHPGNDHNTPKGSP